MDLANLAAADDTRRTDGMYKFSVHILIDSVVCPAQSMKHLHGIFNYPDRVDVKPYNITGPRSRRLLRLLGASKTDITTYI